MKSALRLMGNGGGAAKLNHTVFRCSVPLEASPSRSSLSHRLPSPDGMEIRESQECTELELEYWWPSERTRGELGATPRGSPSNVIFTLGGLGGLGGWPVFGGELDPCFWFSISAFVRFWVLLTLCEMFSFSWIRKMGCLSLKPSLLTALILMSSIPHSNIIKPTLCLSGSLWRADLCDSSPFSLLLCLSSLGLGAASNGFCSVPESLCEDRSSRNPCSSWLTCLVIEGRLNFPSLLSLLADELLLTFAPCRDDTGENSLVTSFSNVNITLDFCSGIAVSTMLSEKLLSLSNLRSWKWIALILTVPTSSSLNTSDLSSTSTPSALLLGDVGEEFNTCGSTSFVVLQEWLLDSSWQRTLSMEMPIRDTQVSSWMLSRAEKDMNSSTIPACRVQMLIWKQNCLIFKYA